MNNNLNLQKYMQFGLIIIRFNTFFKVLVFCLVFIKFNSKSIHCESDSSTVNNVTEQKPPLESITTFIGKVPDENMVQALVKILEMQKEVIWVIGFEIKFIIITWGLSTILGIYYDDKPQSNNKFVAFMERWVPTIFNIVWTSAIMHVVYMLNELYRVYYIVPTYGLF